MVSAPTRTAQKSLSQRTQMTAADQGTKIQRWVCTMRIYTVFTMSFCTVIYTGISATTLVLRVPHHFWSGTIPNCPGRLMICNWFIGLLTPATLLATLTTQLLLKAASIAHQGLNLSQLSTTKFCLKISYLLLCFCPP